MASGRPSKFGDWFLEVGIFVLFAVLLLPAAIAGYAVGKHENETKTVTVSAEQARRAELAKLKTAPAFSADDLNEQPRENWITNGGTLANQRYSPLDEIDEDNVGDVKGVWMTHLRGSATAAKYSAESQPLVYDGVIYVPTGEDDVFAVSVDTGDILWEYKGNLDQTISVVCCGWESRGVALGDGKVYLGKLDGSLVALDQRTGREVWKTQVAPWQQGYSITSAPLYLDGMVITGVSGGEFAIRGRLTAFDADTGKERWRFYTTEPESWAGDSWRNGGAPIWQTPSVDPELGLLYFTTGNANPDNDGSKRAGKNLYAASMVALEYRTGKLKWFFQMVHHDIWDYDAPSPTVLFDTDIDGKTVHGIAEAEKTGWLYLLNRETGEPLLPMPEKPVPQLAKQKTWPTQPIPSYEPFVPHQLTDAQYQAVVKQVEKTFKQKTTVLRAKEIYTPYWTTPLAFTPGPQGGTNWQPSSYSPDTNLVYVCAQGGVTANTVTPTLSGGKQANASPQPAVLGGTLTLAGGFGANTGYFTAIDAATGRIAWQKRWPDSCYAGSVVTRGNLVFVGRSDGRLQAYTADEGDLVWSFQLGAGANNAPTIFERDGKEYIAFYAGGNALAASPHGDNLWLLGLDGTMGEAEAPGGGSGVGHAGETDDNDTNEPASQADGKQVFADNCAGCHGATGHGGNGGPDLSSIPAAKNLTHVIAQVTNGGGGMPAFKGTLSEQEIRAVATYVTQNIAAK